MSKTEQMQTLVAEAARRQALESAKYINDKNRTRQREIAASTHGMLVHDVFDFDDIHGDDIFVWVFRKPGKRDIEEGEHLPVMIIYQEQGGKTNIKFEMVTVRGLRYFLKDGDTEDLLVSKLRQCQVTF